MRISTIKRNNSIHLMYKNIMNDLGQLRTVVSKSYIYNLIQNQTGLSIRTISHVLNHTKEQDTDSLLKPYIFIHLCVL
jgi:hypothetical protein